VALACVVIGLGVNRLGVGLPPRLRDATGDALWALMMFAWVGVLLPLYGVRARAALALGICWAVEFSQMYHTRTLDAWRATTLGRLVLGVGFDARDLAAYAVGVLVGVALTLALRRRHHR
jgi:hypothetical protein